MRDILNLKSKLKRTLHAMKRITEKTKLVVKKLKTLMVTL